MNRNIRAAMAGIILFGLILGSSISAIAAFVYAQCDTYVNIHQSYDLDSQCIGKIYNGNVAEILNEIPDAYLIQSGNVKGWVNKEYFTTEAPKGYTVATVYPEKLNVRSAPSEESELYGAVYANQQIEAVNYENGWVTLAFEDGTYGYVDDDYVGLNTYYGTAKTIEEEQTEQTQMNNYQTYQNNNYNQNNEYDVPLDAGITGYLLQDTGYNDYANDTYTYVETPPAAQDSVPVVEGQLPEPEPQPEVSNPVAETEAPVENTSTPAANGDGQYLSDFAKQYIGNPYVWGGTSLETGADCSGFTKAVLNANGIEVNGRTAADQAAGGTKVSLDQAQAGDLIYYDNGNGVYHIALYNGDGTVTHSSNSTSGVKVSDMNYSGNAAGAVRYWSS